MCHKRLFYLGVLYAAIGYGKVVTPLVLELEDTHHLTDVKTLLQSTQKLNDSSWHGATLHDKETKISKDNLQAKCRDIHHVNTTQKCAFVNSTADCDQDEGKINYNRFIYCDFSNQQYILGIVVLILWWLFLFITLAVTADDFFCPSLVVIAKTLRMSDNIAGVTLLAFGNGAPDVFSAIAAVRTMKSGDAGLAFGALFGAGMFITTVIAGSVSIVKPFHAMERPFLRDVIFYLITSWATFYILYDGKITLAESGGFIGIYGFYVVVVVAGRFVYQHKKRARESREVHPDRDQMPTSIQHARHVQLSNPVEMDNDEDIPVQINGDSHARDGDDVFAHAYMEVDASQPSFYGATAGRQNSPIRPNRAVKSLAQVAEHVAAVAGIGPTIQEDEHFRPHLSTSMSHPQPESTNELMPLLGSGMGQDDVGHPAKEFLSAIKPLDLSDFKESGWCFRVINIFKVPALFLLKLAIPVVDVDAPRHGWNRHLRCLQCILAPLTALYGASFSALITPLGGVFPVWALIILIGLVFAVIIYFTSTNEEPPKYHAVFAFAGFLTAVIWIESIANEIVNILGTFGVVFNISNALLGLTLLAWGNSLGDFIADITMARQGFPRTAISACYGGPLFNMLIGIGVPFTIRCISTGKPEVLNFNVILVVLVAGVLYSLISSLIVLPLLKFKFTKFYGFYCYGIYLVFIIMVILVESGVIPNRVL